MKNIIWFLLVGLMMASCSGDDKSLRNASVTVVDEGAKDAGLDLQALGELVKKSPSPAKLEEELNKPGSINNVDLDHDGKVDYIKVSEEGEGNTKALKFVDELKDGTKTEVADVKIDKGSDNQGSMDINGNHAIYGGNASYHSGFSMGEVLLMAYLFAPHRPYFSPFGYGSYPGYYRPYAPVPTASYRTTVNNYTAHPTGSLATPASRPFSGRSASSPTASQKSFGVRDASKPVGSGGFGSHSSSGSSSPSSPSSSSSSSSSHHTSTRSFGRSRRH